MKFRWVVIISFAVLLAACDAEHSSATHSEDTRENPVASPLDWTLADCVPDRWVGAWAAAPSNTGAVYSDQSLRLILTPLRGGDQVRVRFSNRLGKTPIAVRSVYIGKQESGAELVAGSNRNLRFDGQGEVTIPAGEEAESDPTALSFSAFEHLAVSLFIPAPGGPVTQHHLARQTSFVSAPGSGDLCAQETESGFTRTFTTRPLVVGVDVLTAGVTGVVAAVGDSITDGNQTDALGLIELGIDEDVRYPDFLARRLMDEDRELSVINLGISANRILRDAMLVYPPSGPSLLERLVPEILERSDVTDVILLEGINDLANLPWPGAAEIIAGLEQAVETLKEAKPELNVLVGTLTPAGGATGLYSFFYPSTESRRQEINEYIREYGIGDGYIDFDAAVRDAENPSQINPAYDGGDGLHFSPEGYERLAEAVDLDQLKGRDCSF